MTDRAVMVSGCSPARARGLAAGVSGRPGSEQYGRGLKKLSFQLGVRSARVSPLFRVRPFPCGFCGFWGEVFPLLKFSRMGAEGAFSASLGFPRGSSALLASCKHVDGASSVVVGRSVPTVAASLDSQPRHALAVWSVEVTPLRLLKSVQTAVRCEGRVALPVVSVCVRMHFLPW